MANDKKIFLKNFIWNLVRTCLNSFNSLFFLIIVTRINGIHDAGIFSIAYSTALILYTIGLYSGRLCQVTDIENKVKDKDYIELREQKTNKYKKFPINENLKLKLKNL